jgi:hypothetical protein
MGKRMLIFIVGVIFLTQLKAQSQLIIRGTVQDSSGTLLSKATIQLWRGSDTIQFLSGENGQFGLSVPQGLGEWNILVTMQGFRAYHKPFTVPENTKLFTLPPILLQAEYQELQAVIVNKERPLTIKVDTLDYHAGAYAMREGSMLEDLMKRLPGITLNSDSGLLAMGKKVHKLLLDGKAFYGGDVQVALSNLPYDIIDKVEIIDDYGDQARLTGVKTGQPEKVLNIVLREDKNHGVLGNAAAGFGNLDQYTSNLFGNVFQGDRKLSLTAGANNNNSYGNEYLKGISLGYADRWSPVWSAIGDGGISADNHLFENTVLQNIRFNGGSINQEQNNSTQVHSQAQKANFEWLYASVPNKQLRITTSFAQQTSRETDRNDLSSNELDSGLQKNNQSTITNQSTTRTTSAESKLYFEQVYPHSGQRFSVDADVKYLLSAQRGDNLTQSQIQTAGDDSESLQHYHLSNQNTSWDISGNVHYYFPLGTKGLLESGYALHQTYNHSKRDWQQPDTSGLVWETVDSLSNDYTFRTLTQDFRTGYSRHGNNTDLDLGLIAEPGNLNGASPEKGNGQSYHYFNLFPVASINYSLNRTQKLHLDYETTVAAPTLQQVQPVTDLSNLQYPVTGNPDLKPAVTRSVNLHYELNTLQQNNYQGYTIGFGYSRTQDQIVANVVQPLNNSAIVQETFFTNINGNFNFNMNWQFSLPALLQKRLKLSGWGLINKGTSISMTDYVAYSANVLAWSQHLSLLYTIADKLESDFSLGYDHTLTRYDLAANPPVSASFLACRIENRHYFFTKWTFTYVLVKSFASGISSSLSPQPTYLYATLQRSFGKKSQLVCSLVGSNLTNAKTGVGQSVSATTITQTRSSLVGRVILFSVQWKFERFPRKKL